MSKTALTEELPAAEIQEDFPLHLDEFCRRLSTSVKRPTLIGGFHSFATRQGLLLAREPEFMSAFEAFRRLPA